jgi:hypothetical protein
MIKYYSPIPEIIQYLVSLHKGDAKILEIGPGDTPFPLATHFIDHKDARPNTTILDACTEKFPFKTEEFDFVYARHVLEDVKDPTAIFQEMVRVAKKGYIETPSIMAEMSRDIDGGVAPFRGYVHHRYMLWNKQDSLQYVAKYPYIEHFVFDEKDQKALDNCMEDPFNWNNYYYWNDPNKATIKELKHEIDFDILKDYVKIIADAMNSSSIDCYNFKKTVQNVI